MSRKTDTRPNIYARITSAFSTAKLTKSASDFSRRALGRKPATTFSERA